jgi:hypothetical protein
MRDSSRVTRRRGLIATEVAAVALLLAMAPASLRAFSNRET